MLDLLVINNKGVFQKCSFSEELPEVGYIYLKTSDETLAYLISWLTHDLGILKHDIVSTYINKYVGLEKNIQHGDFIYFIDTETN